MGAGRGALGSRRTTEYDTMSGDDLEREISLALAQITDASASVASSSSSYQASSSSAPVITPGQRPATSYHLHTMSGTEIANKLIQLMLSCVNVTDTTNAGVLRFIRRVREFIHFASHIPWQKKALVREALNKKPSTDALAELLFFRATPKIDFWRLYNQLIPLQLALCEGTSPLFNIPAEEFFVYAFSTWSTGPEAGIRYIEPFIDIENGLIPTDPDDVNQKLASIRQQEESRIAISEWILWCTTPEMETQLRHDTSLALFVVSRLRDDVDGSSQLLHSALRLFKTNISSPTLNRSIMLNFVHNAANHMRAPPPEVLWCIYPTIFPRGPRPGTDAETVRALTFTIRCGITRDRFEALLPPDIAGIMRFNLCLQAARYGRVDLLQVLSVPLLFSGMDALTAEHRLVKLLYSTRMDIEPSVIELSGLPNSIVTAALKQIADAEAYDIDDV